MGGYDWQLTDPMDAELGSAEPNPYPGMRPMSEAPRDGYTHPIIGILRDTDEGEDPRVKVFFSRSVWGGDGRWYDADGDGAPDGGGWMHWDTSDFIGWLPVKQNRTAFKIEAAAEPQS